LMKEFCHTLFIFSILAVLRGSTSIRTFGLVSRSKSPTHHHVLMACVPRSLSTQGMEHQ
jgi:hypothetical protein